MSSRSQLAMRTTDHHSAVEIVQVGLVPTDRRPLELQPSELPEDLFLAGSGGLQRYAVAVRFIQSLHLRTCHVANVDQLPGEPPHILSGGLVQVKHSHEVLLLAFLAGDKRLFLRGADDHGHIVGVYGLRRLAQLDKWHLGIQCRAHLRLHIHLVLPPIKRLDVNCVDVLDLLAKTLPELAGQELGRLLVFGGGGKPIRLHPEQLHQQQHMESPSGEERHQG
mmetsp:Transcript_135941/g.290525  ORF Transcript_135941/g.290525 Transcript_135941/m.290525 type:complete len:222 (-) Transcript_135941:87-752(-)